MAYWQHHRGYDHHGTEDCSTVVLSEAVGRYPAGSVLCDVLADMQERLSLVDADYIHGFTTATLDAFIAPYDPGTLGGSMLGVLGLDAWVLVPQTASIGLDAEIAAPVAAEQTNTFALNAYIADAGGAPVGQIEDPIDADDTVITVPNWQDFPSVCPFVVQIDGEMMLVTDGCGTDTWTVIRGYNGTTATPHAGGSLIAAC